MGVAGDAEPGAHFTHPRFDEFAEGIGVCVKIQRHGSSLTDDSPEFRDGIPLTDNQAAAEGFQIPRERRQAATEEMLTVRSGPCVRMFPSAH